MLYGYAMGAVFAILAFLCSKEADIETAIYLIGMALCLMSSNIIETIKEKKNENT